MKKIIPFLLLFNCFNLFSHELFKIKLDENEKLEGTYSASYANNSSMHVALIRNTNTEKYLFSPYYVDSNNKVTKLEGFVMSKKLQILSYHLNEDIATFINYDEEEKVYHVIDFNISTGKNTSNKIKLKHVAENVFRFSDKTVLVSYDKNEGVSFYTITNSTNEVETKINVPQDKLKSFKAAVKLAPEEINQTEYVTNGSIQKVKSYFIDNSLILTYEIDNETFEVFNFNIESKTLSNKTINPYEKESLRDMSNYVFDKNLATLSVNAKETSLSFYDIQSLNLISKISLTNVVDAPVLNNFIKNASRFSLKPTLTINKNINGKYVIRIDNVDQNTYSYNYNWWFDHWFFQQQMWHQQMMMRQMSMPRGFGPSLQNLEDEKYFFKDQPKAIEFVVDLDLKTVLNETKETVLKNINKDDFVNKYKENSLIKYFSSSFSTEEFRYIYQDKKSKIITIFSEKM